MTLHKCRFCSGVTEPHVSAKDYNRKVDETVFHLRGCTKCGFIDLANKPEDLGRYYNDDYYFMADTTEQLSKQLGEHVYKIEFLKKYVTSGDLLEIGPAIGMFCKLAQDAGFKVSAIEMDQKCARFLESALGVRTIVSDDPATALRSDEQQYDTICMWHSLEHMHKPWEVMEACASRLRPGGFFVIAVPNPEARQIRWMGKFWPHYDLPRHLAHMPVSWLKKRADDAGLETMLVTTRDPGSRFFSRFSYARLLMNIAPRNMQTVFYGIGRRIGALLAPLDAREAVGATYTAVFRKPL
jgi:2-polyprenyl-3-methyl-5-hydroxy-6-metoxy-1,4-benzoquinol methylase